MEEPISVTNILRKCMERCSDAQMMTPQELEQAKADSYNAIAGNLNEQDGYNCTKCLNKGNIMRAFEVRPGIWSTSVRECKCMAVRRTIRNMERSGLKNIIKDYTFDKFVATDDWQKTLKDTAAQYAGNPAGWFYVGGQSGAGKTHICTAICREFLLSGKAVKYMLWRDEVVRLKAVVNDTDEYDRLMDGYKSADVLYIDDLFKTGKDACTGERQRPTPADINIAFEILNYRYNNPKLRTVISSECTMGDILDVDEAIGGRIYERAKVFSLKPDKAKNYRLRGAVEL